MTQQFSEKAEKMGLKGPTRLGVDRVKPWI